MKKQASEELKLVHQDLVLTFCEKSLGLTKLYITCQQHDDQQPCSTLSFEKAHHLPIYILLCFFKKWIGEQYQDGASMFFEKYLHSTYEDVTKTCIQTGTPGESVETRENINALDENNFPLGVAIFVQKVVEMLDKVVPQTTFLFQGLLAQEEKKKVLASTLQIQINSSSTTAATAATAAALQQQAPLQQDDMSKLISNEVKNNYNSKRRSSSKKTPKVAKKNLLCHLTSNQKGKESCRKRKESSSCYTNTSSKSAKTESRSKLSRRNNNTNSSFKQQEKAEDYSTEVCTAEKKRCTEKESSQERRSSRRKEQRCKSRKRKREQDQEEKRLTALTTGRVSASLAAIRKMCIHDHGFVSDPSKTLWENIPLALQVMLPSVYFNRNKNMTCHNLCTFLKPPAGFASLLGLGLKFCIQQKKPPKSLAPCVQKLARSLQIQALYGANATSGDYIPSLYIKSKTC